MFFQCPLLPEPCFVHSDESLREKPVIHFLKEKIDYSSPSNVNTVIADGMFVVRSSLKEKSSTFASFARHILWKSKSRVASSTPRVTSSNVRVTSSNPRVMSSNPRVTSSNP